MLLIETDDTVVDRSLVVIGHPPHPISRRPTHIWSLAALFVSFIYRQSPAGIYIYMVTHHAPAKSLSCFQLQSFKLVGFPSLVETRDEVGHDPIGDDENLPSATNPKPCTEGQCNAEGQCRYTNAATQSGNQIIVNHRNVYNG